VARHEASRHDLRSDRPSDRGPGVRHRARSERSSSP
jgi:hypothetical protein